jgi:hypothetical protein
MTGPLHLYAITPAISATRKTPIKILAQGVLILKIAKYRILTKAERQYDPDKFHQQNIDEVIF